MGEVTGEVHEEVTKQDLLTESLPEPLLIILSPPPPFLPLPGKPTMLWINWLKAFENYIDGLNEQELSDSSRCCLLQNCLGPEGQRVFTSLIQSETPYATAVSVLTDFFTSDQTTQTLRLKFHQRNQAPGETVDQFVSTLEELLKPCNYRDSHEKLILDQLIAKTNYLPLKERLLMERETLTLEGALVICKEVESAFNIGELFGVHEVSVDIDDFEPPVQAKPKRGRPRKGEIRAKPKPESQKIKTSPRPTVKDNYYTNDRLHYGNNKESADNKKDMFEPPVQQKAKRGRPRKGEIRVSQNTNTQKSPTKRSTRTSRYKEGFYYMDDVPYDSDNEGDNLNNVEQVTRIYEPPVQKKAKRGRPRKGETRTNSKTPTSLTKPTTGPGRYKENFYYTNDALYYSDNEEGSSSRADETNLPGDTFSNKTDVEEEYVPHVPQKAKRGRPRKGESRANTKTQTDSNNSNTSGENVAGTSTSAKEVNGALEEQDPALSPTQRLVEEDLDQPSDDDEDDDDYVSSSSRLKGPFCPICENRRFRDAHKLARHMRTHTKEKPFVCPICSTTFSQSYHMTRHMRNQHSAGPFICSTCGKSLETYDELTKHKTTHGRRVQTCPVCQENFTREGAFFTHLMSHTKEQSDPDGPTSWGIDEVNNRVIIPTCMRDNHENEDCSDNVTEVEGNDDAQDVEPDVTFKTETAATNEAEAVGKRRGRGPSKKTKQHICPHCPNRRFKGANKLSRHMRTHTKERPFVCPVCSLTFSQSYHMTRHLRNKHDLGQYICNKCGESVSTWMELKEHKKTHSIAGLTCLACDKQFQDKGALASHLKIHKKVSSPRSLSCSDCGKVFGRMYHLKRHIMSHRKASNSECYTCPDCHKTFVFPEDLNKHLEIHAKENSGTCPKCDQKFGSSDELEAHMTVHDKIYPCSTCGKKFKVEYALRKHEQGHAHDRYYCSLCRKHFIKMSHYKRHILVHNRRESRCPHCGSIFLQLTAFKYHLRTHVEERPYQCSCCIETFEEKEELDQHCLKHRKFKRERPYSCTRCDNAFSSLIELTEHMTLHEGEQPQNCPICGKTFLNKNKLEKHLTIHTGERPHLCSICGNGFPSAASLKLHLHIHTGEKPFECSQCSKTFRSSSGLRLHSRQHMEVRPSYECPECGRTYGRMTELKMHQRYHTGDKPYACTCCSKRFISKDKLNVHMRIHTGERPYSCPHCGQTFTQTGDRNRHISKFH